MVKSIADQIAGNYDPKKRAEQQRQTDKEAIRTAIEIQAEVQDERNSKFQSDNVHKMTDAEFRTHCIQAYGFVPI
jgi:hypothetical protein